jgi:CDP-6-deoxy-D-xylo-4-hexulose-3-dehydrase
MNEVSWPLMHNNITRHDLDSIIEYLKLEDPKLTQGPMVKSFEDKWSKWLGVKHSVMLNSGSSANDLTMIALREIKGLGEVIVPPLTWVSDISAVIRAGLTPVFVDIDPESLAMDNDLILKSINSKTKAVFLSHFGQLKTSRNYADRRRLRVSRRYTRRQKTWNFWVGV